MNTILYLLLTFLLLSIMIVIHELGHFLFAKLFGVTVLEFSIGMGPALFTTKKKLKKSSDKLNISDEFHFVSSETTKSQSEEAPYCDADRNDDEKKTAFSIRAFPIGGYVSMAGEDEASSDVNAFCNKPVWQRLIITVAGAVMNIILGILCMAALVGIEGSDDTLASNTIAEFYVYQDANGSPLYADSTSDKGYEPLMVGDTVLKVNGVRVHTGNELVYEIMHSGYEPVDLLVKRNGEELLLKDVEFPTISESGVTFGQNDFKVFREEASFSNIAKHAIFRSFSTVKVIFDSLIDLVSGRYGADAVSGPVGMAGAVGEATRSGFSSLLYLFILITMNLGVFNLLPIPALDGGRIVFLAIEGIRGKPVKKEVEQTVNTVGIMLLMAVMLFVTVKDIFNLF